MHQCSAGQDSSSSKTDKSLGNVVERNSRSSADLVHNNGAGASESTGGQNNDFTKKMRYGYWRTDKAKEDGYSHEFISADTKGYCETTGATLDDLHGLADPAADTLYKAFYSTVQKYPENPWLGTRKGNDYTWLTFQDSADIAANMSYGMHRLGLIPEIHAEGKIYRFMGIQCKNRAEYGLTFVANMHQSATTVALYDTLGVASIRFIINQTEMTTIAVAVEFVRKYA